MSKENKPQAEGAPMTLAQYQQQAMTTCLPESENFSYMMLNLVGEVGELASKVAKMIRKGGVEFLPDGDITLYHSSNPEADRQQRHVIDGNGDHR